MGWVHTVLAAHLLYAVIFVIDSNLINKHLKNAASYAFFVSILGIAPIILAPFGIEIPNQIVFITALFAGTSFTFGTLFLYRSLKKHETSRVIPIIGGITPIFSFILSYIFLPERLSPNQLGALVMLVLGTVLISYPFHKTTRHHIKPKMVGEMLLAALLFSFWAILSKRVFLDTSFINGLIWIRIGAAVGGLLLLLGATQRKHILHGKKRLKKRSGVLILVSKGLSAIAGLMIYYSISIGNSTLVHALQGVQYVFLFLLILVLSHYFPKLHKEDMRPALLAQKLGSSLIIAFGVAMLLV